VANQQQVHGGVERVRIRRSQMHGKAVPQHQAPGAERYRFFFFPKISLGAIGAAEPLTFPGLKRLTMAFHRGRFAFGKRRLVHFAERVVLACANEIVPR
jgi:hypothetical protein